MCLVCQCQKDGLCSQGKCDGFHYAQSWTRQYYEGKLPLEVAIKAIAHHEEWTEDRAEQYIKDDPYGSAKTI